MSITFIRPGSAPENPSANKLIAAVNEYEKSFTGPSVPVDFLGHMNAENAARYTFVCEKVGAMLSGSLGERAIDITKHRRYRRLLQEVYTAAMQKDTGMVASKLEEMTTQMREHIRETEGTAEGTAGEVDTERGKMRLDLGTITQLGGHKPWAGDALRGSATTIFPAYGREGGGKVPDQKAPESKKPHRGGGDDTHTTA